MLPSGGGRLISWLLLLVCLFALSGCSGTGAPPPGVTVAVLAVIKAVWDMRKLYLTDAHLLRRDEKGDPFEDAITEIGQHVKFFLRRRAELHLQAEPDTDKVAQRIANEYDLVRGFVARVVGLHSDLPTPLIKGTDKSPGHLDLDDVLRVYTTDPPVSGTQRQTQEQERWRRAMIITWNAAALEPVLWIPSFSEAALAELLDRRLRITERMIYQVSSDVTLRANLRPNSVHPTGPWFDDVRVRMFEYPIIAASYESQVDAANIGPGQIWRTDARHELLYYNKENEGRIRGAAKAEFVRVPPAYPFDLVTGDNPAAAVDHLFEASEDWWDRSWIYCDHVLAALNIESLRFAKRRREGSDNTFNAVVNSHPQGWAQLRPLLPTVPNDPGLMGDDASKPPGEPRLFANGPVTRAQLGDQIVFWNSIMYSILSDGAYSLENAVVVDVEADWAKNSIGDSLKLMGHGTGDLRAVENPNSFRQWIPGEARAGRFRQTLKTLLDEGLDYARERTVGSADDNVFFLRLAAPLIRWAPYGEAWTDIHGNPQSPWWVQVPYDPTPGLEYRALGRDATLHTLPDAIEFDPSADTLPLPHGTLPPRTAAYFPLWWPQQNGRWKGYLERRKNGIVPTRFILEETKFFGSNIPGLTLPVGFVPPPEGQLSGAQWILTVRPMVAR